MKFVLISLVASLSLSGCLVISKKPNPSNQYKSAIEFKPSDHVSRIATTGQVICEASKPCPEITFDWKNSTRNIYPVRTDLFDREKFDIQKVTFIVDGQSYQYSPSTQTAQRSVLNSNLTNSSNVINVNTGFINRFNTAQAIDISIFTDKGEMTYSILKNGQESLAYKTFKRGYSQKSNP